MVFSQLIKYVDDFVFTHESKYRLRQAFGYTPAFHTDIHALLRFTAWSILPHPYSMLQADVLCCDARFCGAVGQRGEGGGLAVGKPQRAQQALLGIDQGALERAAGYLLPHFGTVVAMLGGANREALCAQQEEKAFWRVDIDVAIGH